MTIRFNDVNLTYTFTDNGDLTGADSIEFLSTYSNTSLFQVDATIIQSNARYTQLEFTLQEPLGEQHVSGIYTYIIRNSGDKTLSQGVVKVYTGTGAGIGQKPFISNNETREADVYFRPSYE